MVLLTLNPSKDHLCLVPPKCEVRGSTVDPVQAKLTPLDEWSSPRLTRCVKIQVRSGSRVCFDALSDSTLTLC
jgi:hypothetical protein